MDYGRTIIDILKERIRSRELSIEVFSNGEFSTKYSSETSRTKYFASILIISLSDEALKFIMKIKILLDIQHDTMLMHLMVCLLHEL